MKNMPIARKPFINQFIAAAASNGAAIMLGNFSRCVNYRHTHWLLQPRSAIHANNFALMRVYRESSHAVGAMNESACEQASASHACACARMNEWARRAYFGECVTRSPTRPATQTECASGCASPAETKSDDSRFVSHAISNCRTFFARIIQI